MTKQFILIFLSIKANTRGNNYKLLNHSFHYDLRKHYFSARIVNIWNSLPNTIVIASTVNTFTARLDSGNKHFNSARNYFNLPYDICIGWTYTDATWEYD